MSVDPNDETLRNLIGALDLPPMDLVQIAEGLWTWKTIDAELAAVLDERDLAVSTRAGDARHELTLDVPDGESVTVDYLAAERSLVVDAGGQGFAQVVLRQMGRPDAVAIPDEAGRATFVDVDPGSSQLELIHSSGRSAKTHAFGL